MNPTSETKAIFGQAIDIELGAARSAFLDRACDGNRPLRQEIEELISALEGAGDFLNRSAAAGIIDAFSPEGCELRLLQSSEISGLSAKPRVGSLNQRVVGSSPTGSTPKALQ